MLYLQYKQLIKYIHHNPNIAVILILLAVFVFQPFFVVKADIASDIADKQKQIEILQQQIDEYQTQIDESKTKSVTLQNEISKLNATINQYLLEIKSLGLSVNQTGLEIKQTEANIYDAQGKIDKFKSALVQYIKALNENDQKTLTEVILKNDNLSDFFTELNSIKTIQNNIRITIDDIKNLKADLEVKKTDLEDKKTDLERLKSLEEIEKRDLDANKKEKDNLLKQTKGQESKFQELVKVSQKNIQALTDQIFYLRQNGVSVEDAVKYGQLAAIAAGIRPAFLLAILEIESGLGKNVGTGNWMDDMYNCYLRLGKPQRAETEKNAFLTIVNKLGLNPDTVKVSREPNYGCGGALGPAQFIASTWLGYEEEVMHLTGHNPVNPWLVEDAFTASAIKLARGGATSKTKAGESAAARAYVSGNSKCTSSICNYYSNAVLKKAAEIEANL